MEEYDYKWIKGSKNEKNVIKPILDSFFLHLNEAMMTNKTPAHLLQRQL